MLLLEAACNACNSLNNSFLLEMKSYTFPPNAVNQVGEAICLLFAEKPEFQNFIKLLNSDDFLMKLRNFNKEAVSDYTIIQLEKYVKNPNFTYEYISKVSKAGSILCNWVIAIYKYAKIISEASILALMPHNLIILHWKNF